MSTKQTAETENSSDGACVLRVLTFNVTNYILVHLDKVCLANNHVRNLNMNMNYTLEWKLHKTCQYKYDVYLMFRVLAVNEDPTT